MKQRSVQLGKHQTTKHSRTWYQLPICALSGTHHVNKVIFDCVSRIEHWSCFRIAREFRRLLCCIQIPSQHPLQDLDVMDKCFSLMGYRTFLRFRLRVASFQQPLQSSSENGNATGPPAGLAVTFSANWRPRTSARYSKWSSTR